ncbi:MAG: type II toxin-antitoxin system RelE/ParE family toxin [Patescibacteria group bacterium]
MDKIDRALNKLIPKEREQIKNIIKSLQSGRFNNLDIRKLKGLENIFRVRKGGIRIIYQVINKEIFIIKIDKRKENTYKF